MSDIFPIQVGLTIRTQDTLQGRFRVMMGAITVAAAVLLAVSGDGWQHSGVLILSYASGKFALLAFAVIVHMLAFRFRLKGPVGAEWSKAYVRSMKIGDIILAYTALTITLVCFTIFKTQSVGASGYIYDAIFAQWDAKIFGSPPWEITHAVFASPRATAFLDTLYHPLFLPMIVGFIVAMVAQVRPALRYTYMASYIAGYVVVGMVFANMLPSAGPIYDGALYGDGSLYQALIARLAEQQSEAPMTFVLMQDYLLQMQNDRLIGFGGGISAMPSMHIVLVVLWAIAAWHLNRWLGAAMSIYGLLIWAASVHLGWHYFVDGLVAIALIAPIWFAMGWFFKLYGPRDARAVSSS